MFSGNGRYDTTYGKVVKPKGKIFKVPAKKGTERLSGRSLPSKSEKKCGEGPVVAPKSNWTVSRRYGKKFYKGRKVVKRNFRTIEQFRRVFTRYDKLYSTAPIIYPFSLCVNLCVLRVKFNRRERRGDAKSAKKKYQSIGVLQYR